MDYDAIVVGARVAGSPTAMLLARAGHRVLMVDRATFPSDTLSTHVIHVPGVAALARWGLLDELTATGCPPIGRYTFDFGAFTLDGTTAPVEGIDVAYAPRRTVLDTILVDAARDAGAEVRENCNVDEVLVESGTVVGVRCGDRVERAAIVIGADGRSSRVAKDVGAVDEHAKPRLQYAYFTYFSGLPTEGLETFIRPDRGFACAPTNAGQTMVVVGWPYAEARAYKADVEGNFLQTLGLAPSLAERVAAATREAPFLGGAVPAWLRKPYGAGWALVGDAAHLKDPITAQGISDGFRDAEHCAAAVDAWLGGESYEEVMGHWHRSRDASALPMYEFTAQLATLELPPPELQQVLGAVACSQESTDGFMSMVAGVVSPADFFSEENVGRIMASAPSAV